MLKFFVWAAICAYISPVLGIIYVTAEIVWLVATWGREERTYRRPPSSLT